MPNAVESTSSDPSGNGTRITGLDNFFIDELEDQGIRGSTESESPGVVAELGGSFDTTAL